MITNANVTKYRNSFFSGCYDGIIHNHDVRLTNHLVSELCGHTQGICGLVWSPDGKLLASGGNDNMVNIWAPSISAQSPMHSLTDHMGAVKVGLNLKSVCVNRHASRA